MNVAKLIDHTALKANTTKEDILKLIEEAKEYGFFSVCINPYWVSLAAKELAESDVKVCTVIGFPLGANSSAVKAAETKQAIEDGANEVDMVINVGALKSGDEQTVLEDIKAVVDATAGKTLVKVIIETALLTDEEKVKACQLAVEAGADFVKTSTGFSTAGAKPEDVKLMKETVGDKAEVKASGGIHSKADVDAMVEAGATRIGASAGIAIVTGAAKESTGY
ncbi:deoxyribose-phosphate aldolase [Vagococcus lutrae]|uniref:deoxyribose-phosphate aldolase n=1 Tax=Vagococcus lutrae TaxID=81947 RepID=UPI001C98701C|nr:deoxyribose-phosphate aldolase [Vagococcus lutrae]MDT2817705.1 deoxyribose-phosphate aldolase [Vagococcus lutrae]QZN87901.1 deoxyribose-phosphate aldolase [Vagococcus lutrae]